MPILSPDPDPAIDALLDDIDTARAESYPLVLRVCRWEEGILDTPTPLLDALASLEGYLPLGANWIEIPRRIATKMLTHLIASELAYPTTVTTPETADALSRRFLELFAPGARYFTNGACSGPFAIYNLAGEEVVGWRSISAAPFDNGVIAVSTQRIGILWAEDAP